MIRTWPSTFCFHSSCSTDSMVLSLITSMDQRLAHRLASPGLLSFLIQSVLARGPMPHSMSLRTYLQITPRAVSSVGWNWEGKENILKLVFCFTHDLWFCFKKQLELLYKELLLRFISVPGTCHAWNHFLSQILWFWYVFGISHQVSLSFVASGISLKPKPTPLQSEGWRDW